MIKLPPFVSASLGLLSAMLRRELRRGRQGVIMVVGDSGSLLPEGETEYSLYIGIAVLISTGLPEPVDISERSLSRLCVVNPAHLAVELPTARVR